MGSKLYRYVFVMRKFGMSHTRTHVINFLLDSYNTFERQSTSAGLYLFLLLRMIIKNAIYTGCP